MTAYALIKQYGWVQGKWGSPRDGFCILGAIGELFLSDCERVAAWERVRAAIDSPCIEKWNDTRGRTKRQVLAALKQAGV
jgi:hypothetical protein